MREQGDKEASAIAGVFTSRIVGILFSLAFGAWALVLGSVKNDILNGQANMQKDMVDIKAKVYEHQLFSAQATAEFRAEITDSKRRLELLEQAHRNGSLHVENH